jgi:hypothetical protein
MKGVAERVEVVGRGSAEGGGGGSRSGPAGSLGALPGGCWGERVAVVCEVSVEGGGGVRREVLRDLWERPWGSPPRGSARVSVTSAEGRPVGVEGLG